MWIAGCLAVLLACHSEPIVGPEEEAVPIATQDAPSSEQQLTPEADTYVADGGDKHQNFGTDPLLRVEQNGDKRSLARWDLDAITNAVGGDSLVKAELVFTVSSNGGGWGASGGVIHAHAIHRAWTEQGATRKCPDDSDLSNNKADCSDPWSIGGDPQLCIPFDPDSDVDCPTPTFRPTSSDSLIATDELGGEVSFEVTEDVREMLADEAPAIPYREGWLLRKADDKAKGSVAFGSRESGVPPRLVLTTVRLESTVPAVTPDGVPDSIYDAENVISDSPLMSGTFLRNIILVVFREDASRAERQEAVDLVGGEVVGGKRVMGDDGFYFVRIEDDGTAGPLFEAIETLQALPQVVLANPELLSPGYESYRRPTDGSGFDDWSLSAREASGDNWGLERIAAPLGWGCSIGDRQTGIAVIDRDFHAISELTDNLDTSLGLGAFTGGKDHGTLVASVLAANGNDSTKITGTMWRAGLRLLDYGVDSAGNITRDSLGRPVVQLTEFLDRVEDAARGGASVINMSVAADTSEFVDPGPSAPKRDSTRARNYAAPFYTTLKDLDDDGIRPLIVLGAGNGGRGTRRGVGVDAYWAAYSIVRDSFPDRILVVAATEQDGEGDAIAGFSNDNSGQGQPDLVEIAAPGVDITTLVDGEQVVSRSGTSVAAPFVSGVAGLLASFDSNLTASQLKEKILEGAQQGGRAVPAGDGSIPVLNAHEALKAAAERDGAPLCGNRVWTADGNIKARRTANVVETLVSGVPEPTGQVEVLHGGKHLLFVTPGQGFFAQWSSEGWGPGQSLPTNFDELRGGTRRSVFGESHDRDSIADIDVEPILGDWYFSEASRQAPVELNLVEDGTTVSAGSIVVDNIEDALQQTCIERDPVDTSTCYVTLTEQRLWLLRLGYPQLPSPSLEGLPEESSSVVAVNPLRSVVVGSDEWQPCGVNTDRECRRVDIRQFHVKAQISTLDLRAGAGETSEPLVTLPDESVFWIGQSENNDELVLARGQWLATWEGHADTLRTTGTPFFNRQTSTQDCRIEYREQSNFSQVNDVIPTLDACEGGTVGDPSAGAGGGTIAPIIAPVEGEGTGTEKSFMLPLVTSLESGLRSRQ